MPGVSNPISEPLSCQTISNFLDDSDWNLPITLFEELGAPTSKIDVPVDSMRSLSNGARPSCLVKNLKCPPLSSPALLSDVLMIESILATSLD